MEAIILWAILDHAPVVFATQAPLAAELRSFNDNMFPSYIRSTTKHVSIHVGARRKATVTCARLAHTVGCESREDFWHIFWPNK